ncbi:uncharacterized protein LOC6547926 [Drosophila erecta]|uniref:Uncharacterized protein n=1 Tax=Drosophila erecta TaxID=7220 RepID=B3NJV7_DROER|nr:uncharacterized protein LOC6547926 [Drosophila erecta]EDV55433.1 uncharacterized protein Dere_GG20791 [Drosophila erecta]
MEMRDRLYQLMVNQSYMSRATETASMSNYAMGNLSISDATEKAVIKLLLVIEEKYRSYFDSYKKEVELQRIAAETLHQLIQRYKIAMQLDVNCTCPQIYDIESDDAIINKFYIHYQVIASSNKNQCWAIQALRPYVLLFRRECAKLHMSEESPFSMGDAFHKPIQFFIDLVEELFAHFYSGHLQLDCAARLLDPLDLTRMEDYMKLLEPNEDFDEYFLHNISFCKCMRQQLLCPPNEHHKKVKDQSDAYLNHAKQKRCARRFEKMAQTSKRGSRSAERKLSIGSAKVNTSPSRQTSVVEEPVSSQQRERNLTDQLISVLCVAP